MPLKPPSTPLAAAAEPLVNRVYSVLADAILTLELAPGEAITEVEAAATLGVSRTPVREALRRLEDDGLVVIEPNRGTHVAGIDPDFVREVGAVLAALCGMAAEAATPLLTAEDLQWFLDLERDLMRRAVVDPDQPGTTRAAELMTLLLDRSEQRVLRHAIRRLRPHVTRLFSAYGTELPVVTAAERMATVVSAARVRDKELMAVAVRSYYAHFTESLLELHLAAQGGAAPARRKGPASATPE